MVGDFQRAQQSLEKGGLFLLIRIGAAETAMGKPQRKTGLREKFAFPVDSQGKSSSVIGKLDMVPDTFFRRQF